MDLGLKGKRALVLGSTRGIGRGVAEALAAEGARVAICGRDGARAAAVAAEIGSAAGFAVDLMDPESVAGLISAVEAAFGGVDCLFLNSGGPPPMPLAETPSEAWQTQLRGMFLSQTEVVAAFLPGMRSRGWGRIVVTSTSGAIQPQPWLGISNVMRAGLSNWVKTLADEIAADGVTVNTIMPGRIHTERVDELDRGAAKRQGRTMEEIAAASRASIPAGRYGTVAEYAAAAAFLMSAPASYVTGIVLRVDGGFIRAV